tara:strand:+ start:534 stop:749 length:216 start_codon:yes stop_codon:yes gene_type:complete
MWYRIAPTVKVWLSKIEIEILAIMDSLPERQMTRSSLKHEQYAGINLLVSKSIIWRKKIPEDVLYGKKKKS